MKLLIIFIICSCISFFGQGHFPKIVTGISGWISIILIIPLIVKVIIKIFSPCKNPKKCICSLCGDEFLKIGPSTLCSKCLEIEVHRRYVLKTYNKHIK